MRFPKELLADHERVVFDLRPHWLALAGPALWTVAAVVALVWADNLFPSDWDTWVLSLKVAIAVAWVMLALRPALQWKYTMFVLTSDRLITRQGVIAKHSKEIPLERINDVSFNQSVFERIVKAGDLMIESAGESGQTRITNVRDPESVQLAIYEEAEVNSDRMMRGGRPLEGPPDIPQQIEALARLRDQGVLSDIEFEAKKRELLKRL